VSAALTLQQARQPSRSLATPTPDRAAAELELPHWPLVEAACLLLLLAVALATRLHDPEGPRSAFPDLFDEGIRAAQLQLMANGFRPFREIYAAQGLLLLDLLYPLYVLFGGTLGAARLGVGVLSVLGLIGAWWSVRQLAGAAGGLIAALLLVTSPVYSEASRQALAEVPSLVPSIWAIGCGVRWVRGGRPAWLYAAALLATLGVLIKPMAVAALVPLAVLALCRPGVQVRHLLVAAGACLALTVVVILVMGPVGVFEQIVQYRLGARQGGSWDPRRNYKLVVVEPFLEQPALFLLFGVSALLLLKGGWRGGLAFVLWPLATAAVLVAHFPLHPKHLVYLYPPLALVGGAGLGRAVWLAWSEGPLGRPARMMTVALAALLVALPPAALPVAFGERARTVEDEDADLNVFDRDAAASLQALAGPREFVLTDHPYVAALAGRLVPPNLVDPSRGRTRAGVLTDRDAITAAQEYDARLVLIWADRLRRLSGVPPWLDKEYRLVQAFGTRIVKNPRGAKDRSIYLRRDADWNNAKAQLEAGLEVREQIDFDGRLRLLGATVSTHELRGREQFTVTLGWQALSKMSADYHVTLYLIGAGHELRSEQEHDLEGSVRGTSTWEPGRWMFRTFAIQPLEGSQAGEYLLQIAVVDPGSGRKLRPTLAEGASQFRVDPSRTVTIASIQLR
jgi:hypothetical protein